MSELNLDTAVGASADGGVADAFSGVAAARRVGSNPNIDEFHNSLQKQAYYWMMRNKKYNDDKTKAGTSVDKTVQESGDQFSMDALGTRNIDGTLTPSIDVAAGIAQSRANIAAALGTTPPAAPAGIQVQ